MCFHGYGGGWLFRCRADIVCRQNFVLYRHYTHIISVGVHVCVCVVWCGVCDVCVWGGGGNHERLIITFADVVEMVVLTGHQSLYQSL